ncbi:helix-turn-helix domain-containing protein [Paenibacillus oryzisoli]|uniref:helix-turn-helix domain-containing protein n=1 Tax=Paenibacillus oryzisoli TaxID=1850517 RepID=UPI003D2AAD3B
MKTFIFRDRSGSVFMKVFYSYILIITLPMILFGLLTYYWLTTTMEKEMQVTYSSVVEDIRTEIDRNFQTLDMFAVQLSYMPWATKLMNMEGPSLSYDRLDINLLLNIIQELRIFQATYPLVDEIAIDFKGKDTIISTVGKDNRERFFADLIRYRRLTPDDWFGMLEQQNNRSILPPEEVSVLNQSKRMITYLHSLPPGNSSFQATLLLLIREDMIQEMLGKSALIKMNGSVYVADRQGNWLTSYHGNPEIRMALLQNERVPTSGGDLLRMGDGSDYMVYSSAEGANGWSYKLVVPANTLTGKLKTVRIVAVAVVIFYLVIGFVISFMLARRDYRPIAQILNLVRTRQRPVGKDNNEYMILEQAIYAMLNDVDRSEHEILLYKPFARNTCLTRLLKNDRGTADITQTLELLDITFPHDNYRCLILLLSEDQLVSESFLELVKSGLDQSIASIYWVELDGRSKSIILNVDSQQASEHAIQVICEGLYSMSVAYRAIGVGRLCQSIDDLHRSYGEALHALEYRFIQEEGSTLYVERFADTVTWKGTIQEEEELKVAIRNGQAEVAVEKAHRVVRMEVQTYQLSLDGIRFLCYRVATVALITLEELNIAELPEVNWNELLQQNEFDAMLTEIRRLYEEAVRLVIQEREGRNDHLIREIRLYLETHYTDQNLSLTSVADTFGISSSYLSRYFKNQTGTNFVDYVNRCRIEASKRLLTGETTILQIAQKVGFDNDITYRRLFKKYMGITPSQYKGAP